MGVRWGAAATALARRFLGSGTRFWGGRGGAPGVQSHVSAVNGTAYVSGVTACRHESRPCAMSSVATRPGAFASRPQSSARAARAAAKSAACGARRRTVCDGGSPSVSSARDSPRSTRLTLASAHPTGQPTSNAASTAIDASPRANGAATRHGTSGSKSQGKRRTAPAPTAHAAKSPETNAPARSAGIASGL